MTGEAQGRRIWTSALAVAALALATSGSALTSQADPQLPPFRIIGNLYYVGGSHGAYLIATRRGLILINSNYPDSPPLIRASVEKLGFRWRDIRLLLISHAHVDHAGGSARIVRETGARYAVMEGDADVVESGGRTDSITAPIAANIIRPPMSTASSTTAIGSG